tara:strand:- start:4183 stop:4617 length:435 start_codon:yes stop_codon:yes gene_type:complete
MEEKKLLREGNYAITTHRVVWDEKGAYNLDDFDLVYVSKDDWWKSAAITAVIGIALIASANMIAVGVGLLMFLWSFASWHMRSDKIRLVREGHETVSLPIPNTPSGFSGKVHNALEERRAAIRDHNLSARSESAKSSLDDIDSL